MRHFEVGVRAKGALDLPFPGSPAGYGWRADACTHVRGPKVSFYCCNENATFALIPCNSPSRPPCLSNGEGTEIDKTYTWCCVDTTRPF